MTRRTHDADFAERLGADYRQVEISPRERALLDYAAKLTLHPARMSEADLKPLREVDFSDGAILDLNLVVSYFAYVNRIAQGLGVALEPHVRPPEAS